MGKCISPTVETAVDVYFDWEHNEHDNLYFFTDQCIGRFTKAALALREIREVILKTGMREPGDNS